MLVIWLNDKVYIAIKLIVFERKKKNTLKTLTHLLFVG